jgi:gamma-glutamyltranspeptidase/glutathione hydrolase
LTLERLKREGLDKELPWDHPYTVTVPGAAAAWCDLVERFGRLPLGEVLAPAIRLAEEGAPVAPVTSWWWKRSARSTLARALNGRELTIGGRGPEPGEIWRNPGLGRTLRALAAGGKQAYYQGPIGEAVADVVQKAGGCLAVEDLAAHTSTWAEPVSTTYHDLRLYECPPNGQGLAALLALNILEGFDLASLPPLSPARLHLEIEAMRLAFADARRYVADPAFSPAPLAGLLDKSYAAARRRLIELHRALPLAAAGTPPDSSDTVYLTVVDGEGNACSFINSNYMGFGTGIVPSGWGFSLQNRGHNFSLDPHHPNALAPGKRPYHTIIPAMVTHAASGELYASYGVMGGFMQPQGHMQVLVALHDDRLDPQAALDRPRFCIEPDVKEGRISLEEGIPPETVAALQGMGHRLELVGGMERALFGRGQVIRRDPVTGVLCGGSDPRADGCAMALG